MLEHHVFHVHLEALSTQPLPPTPRDPCLNDRFGREESERLAVPGVFFLVTGSEMERDAIYHAYNVFIAALLGVVLVHDIMSPVVMY